MSIIQLIMFSLWLTLFIQIFVTLPLDRWLEWLTEALNNQEPGTYFLYSTVSATYMCQRQLSGSMFPSAALIPPCGAKTKTIMLEYNVLRMKAFQSC